MNNASQTSPSCPQMDMAEAAKHTPGPWTWAYCHDGDHAFLKGDGLYVASPESTSGDATWIDISEANARLIAAAPALLAFARAHEAWEALLIARGNWNTPSGNPQFSDEIYDAFITLQGARNAVIAQATSQQPQASPGNRKDGEAQS